MKIKFLQLLSLMIMPFVFSTAYTITFLPLSTNRRGMKNLTERLGFSRPKSRMVFAQVLAQYVYYFFELFVLWPCGLLKYRGSEKFGNTCLLIRSQFKIPNEVGLLCLGAHYANIEAVGLMMQREFTRVGLKPYVVLAKKSKIPIINWLFEFVRQKRGLEVLWTGGPEFKQKFNEILSTGKSLALINDQKQKQGGSFVEFFGKKANFADKGVTSAAQNQMGVVHVTVRRICLGYFEVLCEPGDCSHLETQENVDIATKNILNQFAKWLEEVIRKEPGQWSWDYNKWSRNHPN